MKIHLGYVERGVTQDQLQRHQISAVHVIANGKGVSEKMRMQPRHISSFAQPLERLRQAIIAQRCRIH